MHDAGMSLVAERSGPRLELADLERRAFSDPLTGLANRTLLHDRLTQALARHQRRGGGVALLLVDVDHFKSINDRLGHQAGDAVLVQLGARLRTLARAEDTVARMGGEEFAVLLEQVADPVEAALVARRLRAELARPYDVPDLSTVVTATVSVGVALADAATSDDHALYRCADLALYRAKEAGRDRFVVFDDGLRVWTAERSDRQERLRRAFAVDELGLWVEPVRDLWTGASVARHVHATLPGGDGGPPTPLSPPLVGDAVLAAGIDAWLVERALTCPGDERVEVEVSARTLLQPGLADRLADLVAAAGRTPEQLVVGVGERDLFDHLQGALPAVTALRGRGMLVALLDVRGDRLPMRRLAELDVDAACLSPSLLRDADADTVARAAARAMTAMFVDLGVLVGTVALDTAPLLDLARDLGCTVGSGAALDRAFQRKL